MIELLVLGATLGIAGWATGARAYRRTAASRALDQYATSRGLRYVPPPATPPGASPRVLGTMLGVEYAVDLYRLGGDVRTRVRVTVARGGAPLLSVAQRGAFAWDTPPALCVGDAAFDEAYLVTKGAAEDAEELRCLVGPLLALHRREAVWLSSDGSHVAISWRGAESDPLMLDAARDAVVTVACWHRTSSPYR